MHELCDQCKKCKQMMINDKTINEEKAMEIWFHWIKNVCFSDPYSESCGFLVWQDANP